MAGHYEGLSREKLRSSDDITDVNSSAIQYGVNTDANPNTQEYRTAFAFAADNAGFRLVPHMKTELSESIYQPGILTPMLKCWD
jgi:hypothetical protein